MQTSTWVHIGYKLRGNVQISKSLPSNSALERRFNSLYGAGQAAEIAKQPGKATAYYQQLLKVCDTAATPIASSSRTPRSSCPQSRRRTSSTRVYKRLKATDRSDLVRNRHSLETHRPE